MLSGAPPAAHSSLKISCSTMLAPRPPWARGQVMPAQPPSCSVRCQAFEVVDALRRRARRALRLDGEEAGEGGVEPAADVAAEGLLGGGEAEVHGRC